MPFRPSRRCADEALVFDNVGDEIDFWAAVDAKIGCIVVDSAFAEMAAEVNLLGWCDLLSTKNDNTMFVECRFDFGENRIFEWL